MLQIVTEFCLLHLTASHAGCKYFFLSSKVHAENFSRRYMCVCIATAVDFSIQVQMNQWKIVWLPVWMNLMLLLEVVLSLVRVVDPLIYYFYYILFLLSKCHLRDRFIRLLHLHEKLAREYLCVCVCVRACVRAYVCRGCVCVRTYVGAVCACVRM